MNYMSSRKAEPVIAGQTVISQSPATVDNLIVEDPTIQMASNDEPTHQSGRDSQPIDDYLDEKEVNTKKSVVTPVDTERKIESNEWTGDQTQSANIIPNVQINEEKKYVS